MISYTGCAGYRHGHGHSYGITHDYKLSRNYLYLLYYWSDTPSMLGHLMIYEYGLPRKRYSILHGHGVCNFGDKALGW